MEKYKTVKSETVSAWIEVDTFGRGVGAHLMVSNNGYQASGAAMYSLEAAEAALEALQSYVNELKENTK